MQVPAPWPLHGPFLGCSVHHPLTQSPLPAPQSAMAIVSAAAGADPQAGGSWRGTGKGLSSTSMSASTGSGSGSGGGSEGSEGEEEEDSSSSGGGGRCAGAAGRLLVDGARGLWGVCWLAVRRGCQAFVGGLHHLRALQGVGHGGIVKARWMRALGCVARL